MTIRNEIETSGIARWMVIPRAPKNLQSLLMFSMKKPWNKLTWLAQRRLKNSAKDLFWPNVANVIFELPIQGVPETPRVEGLNGWAVTTRTSYVDPGYQ